MIVAEANWRPVAPAVGQHPSSLGSSEVEPRNPNHLMITAYKKPMVSHLDSQKKGAKMKGAKLNELARRLTLI